MPEPNDDDETEDLLYRGSDVMTVIKRSIRGVILPNHVFSWAGSLRARIP